MKNLSGAASAPRFLGVSPFVEFTKNRGADSAPLRFLSDRIAPNKKPRHNRPLRKMPKISQTASKLDRT